MDFRFTPEQEALRESIREFLRQELPPDRQESALGPEWGSEEEWEFGLAFTKKLAQRGWLTAHWPKEYGGLGFSVMEQVVLREELAYHRAPVVNANGVNMLGPVLILYGTEEQRRRHLPGIASCEVIWCQGYSEPNAGSDLASLQTRAVWDGDEYIINGTKIWTGHAHRAQWMFLLARTDPSAPKHRGISFFMLDMKTPGITIVPLLSMAGFRAFNQEFFENVRVPKENLVGEENRGWYIGATLLDFERSNIAGAASARRDLDELIAYCQESKAYAGNPFYRSLIRNRLADLIIEAEVGRFMSYRVATIQASGQVPNYEASIAKLFHSELGQRIARTGVQMMGLYGAVMPESLRWAKLRGRFTMTYMTSLIHTIGGGTSEIQRNIIATRGLGLPRD